MQHATRVRGGRRVVLAVTAVVLAAATTGCGGGAGTGPVPTARDAPTVMGSPSPLPAGAAASPTPSATQPRENVSDPVRVRIASIGVDAAVGPLGLDAAGALQVPTDFAAAGWYEPGPEPGERGPAVVAGHVDDYTGPAVFYRLTALRAGDEVIIDTADQISVTFRVRSVETYPKDQFPTARVYGPTDDAQLRLITCGGGFDGTARRYLDNVVVYADMAAA